VKKNQEVLSLLQEQVDIIWHTVQKYSWVTTGVIVTVCSIITMCYIMITAIWHTRQVSCDHPITFYTPESDMVCLVYEVVSKIFWTGAAIYTAVVVVRSTIRCRTTMSSESVCQVAHSWVDMGSFHMHLFGVVYVTCGNGSEKGTASVHQILCQSWEKCYGDPHNDSTSLWGSKLESCAVVSMACPVQDRSHIS